MLLLQMKMKEENNSTSLREREGGKSSGHNKCFIFPIFSFEMSKRLVFVTIKQVT